MGVTKQLKHPAAQCLAGLCSLLVVLAGMLSANLSWHEALHDHGNCSASPKDHRDDDDSAPDETSTCAVCTFALQQVASTPGTDATLPTPIAVDQAAGVESIELMLDPVWPEPSGRGPPTKA